ncbi:unnamed protein product, partial [Trichogramma brassicae]
MIEEGFQIIETFTENKFQGEEKLLEKWNNFFDHYFTAEWMKKVKPQVFSVFNCVDRTNNYLESYHRTLNQDMRAKPFTSAFIADIRTEKTDSEKIDSEKNDSEKIDSEKNDLEKIDSESVDSDNENSDDLEDFEYLSNNNLSAMSRSPYQCEPYVRVWKRAAVDEATARGNSHDSLSPFHAKDLVQSTWNSLKSKYYRELAQSNCVSGSRLEDIFQSTWVHFQDLNFLKDHELKAGSSSSLDDLFSEDMPPKKNSMQVMDHLLSNKTSSRSDNVLRKADEADEAKIKEERTFFDSTLRHVIKVPPEKKMIMRNKIHDIVHQYAYKDDMDSDVENEPHKHQSPRREWKICLESERSSSVRAERDILGDVYVGLTSTARVVRSYVARVKSASAGTSRPECARENQWSNGRADHKDNQGWIWTRRRSRHRVVSRAAQPSVVVFVSRTRRRVRQGDDRRVCRRPGIR